MFKQTMTAALVAATLMGAGITAAYADEAAAPTWGTFGGSVAFTTNYNFRGFSQTKDDPAIQAGVTYTSPWGFYATAWASSIKDFGVSGLDTNLEVDLGGGYATKFDNFSIDIGGVYYLYPGANDNNTATKTAFAPELNYYEFYGKFGYDFGVASVLASVYGSPNNFGKTGGEIYYNGYVTVPLPFLPWNAALSGGVGYQTFLDDVKKGASVDYLDYSVGLGVTVPGIGVGLDFRYVGTDLKESECSLDTCKGTFIFTASKSF